MNDRRTFGARQLLLELGKYIWFALYNVQAPNILLALLFQFLYLFISCIPRLILWDTLLAKSKNCSMFSPTWSCWVFFNEGVCTICHFLQADRSSNQITKLLPTHFTMFLCLHEIHHKSFLNRPAVMTQLRVYTLHVATGSTASSAL